MIPKIIHYCWFGGNPLPEDAKRYIETWKKYCPDYEIKEWNERNFDVTQNVYCNEAYEAKKWAFVADYARLKILEQFGGIYMDTDEEVIKNLDVLLQYRAFAGFEENPYISMGMIGSTPHNEWIQALLKDYETRHFFKDNGTIDLTTIVERTTKITKELYGVKLNNSFQIIGDQIAILPMDYLCAKSYMTDKIIITENTLAIQHFNGSWLPWYMRIRHEIKIILVKFLGVAIIKRIKAKINF